MPTVNGFLDDVEQLDVDTVQVEKIILWISEIYVFAQFRKIIYFCTIQNEEDGRWEVEKEYTFIPSRSLVLSCCYVSNIFVKVQLYLTPPVSCIHLRWRF